MQSYTNGEFGDGIHVFEFNSINGQLTEIEKVSNMVNASFVALAPNGQFLYACTETKLETDGNVSAFQIDTTSGKLTFINKQTAGGRNPVHLNTGRGNKYLVNANFTDAGLAIYTINTDGSLNPYSELIEFTGSSITKGRQDEAHLHSTIFSPDRAYLFAMDLGTDKIHSFKFDLNNPDSLVSFHNSSFIKNPGYGPRHFTFHPNNKFGYCVNEINGTVSSYIYEDGNLKPIDIHPSYEIKLDTYQSADIHISPDGMFLYSSNRGDIENSIAIFSIDPDNGKLELVGHQSTYGKHPRSFVIDPSGDFLLVANQLTGNIVTFRRNKETGMLSKLEQEIQLSAPASLKMRKYNTDE